MNWEGERLDRHHSCMAVGETREQYVMTTNDAFTRSQKFATFRKNEKKNGWQNAEVSQRSEPQDRRFTDFIIIIRNVPLRIFDYFFFGGGGGRRGEGFGEGVYGCFEHDLHREK